MSGLRGSKHLKIQLKEIELATKNFETCIGKGGYGLVYKGELYIAGKLTTVAVKRLNEHLGQGLKEFLTEIHLLTGQKHPNLISLLGYCDEGKEKIIVYEYAERGSLDKYLTSSNTNYTLTWLERLKICVVAARGLDHLHNHVGKHQTIIHRDIKSANILVDQNWVAKISDLGLSKLSFAGLDRSAVISHACGTPGYCEPEYIDTGIVKKESDVYSFGMVLFEVLCGRLCSFRHHDGLLLSARLAKDYYEKTKLDEIIDPGLRDQMNFESKNKFSTIAYRCVQDDRDRRPGMDLVVKELVESLEIQARYELGKPHHYYGPVVSDLKAAGKRTMEWDLNGWKRDSDLFAATALGKSLQLFPELQTNPGVSDSSSPSSVEINSQNDKGKRELENRRRVMVLEEEEVCDEAGALNLKLGLQLYPITEDEAERWEGKSGKKSKVPGATSNHAVCQVDDCRTDLRNAKDYHRRHKVCELHSRATKALVLKEMQRFCQQCSRFHILEEFDEGKRSCRRRLAGHKYAPRRYR